MQNKTDPSSTIRCYTVDWRYNSFALSYIQIDILPTTNSYNAYLLNNFLYELLNALNEELALASFLLDK